MVNQMKPPSSLARHQTLNNYDLDDKALKVVNEHLVNGYTNSICHTIRSHNSKDVGTEDDLCISPRDATYNLMPIPALTVKVSPRFILQ